MCSSDLPDGKPVAEMRGIYGLDALSSMVRDLELDYVPKLGRGFQARVWQEAIHAYLNSNTTTATTTAS